MSSVKVKADNRRRPTIKDVAEELGVAPSTVSNAYNRPDQLSARLREKILATAEQMGYLGPDPAARNLRRGVTNTIGVLYPDRLSYAFTDPAAALFVQGIALEVEREGYTLLLVGGTTESPLTGVATVIPAMTANVDGFIVHCFADGDPLLQAALARELPTVMVDNPGLPRYTYVAVDDEGGARLAAEHLLALGHHRMGIVSLELSLEAEARLIDPGRQEQASYGPTRARLAGYRRAVEGAGLDWRRAADVFETSANSLEQGREAAAALLARDPRPTAILAMSDQLALGVLAHARESGMAVPGELSVVGFDDAPGAAQANPALTTVHQPHVEKGRRSGRLLVDLLQGESEASPVTLPTRLVVRESTARPDPGA